MARINEQTTRLAQIIATVDRLEGWLSRREIVFLYQTAKQAVGGAIVEIGSYKGRSTVCLALGSSDGHRVAVHAVDPHVSSMQEDLHEGSSWEIFQRNVREAGIEELVVPWVCRSDEVFERWQQPISLLWIDGDHSYETTRQEVLNFTPFLQDGATVAFHDLPIEGVQRVIAEVVVPAAHFHHFGQIDQLFYCRKSTRLPAPRGVNDRLMAAWLRNYNHLTRLPAPVKKYLGRPLKAALSGLWLRPQY
jgi:predicted O-methyltransferase YrrM